MKQIFEIIKNVKDAKTNEAKVKVLRENDTVALRTILKLTYDPNITFKLPEGKPPYKPYPDGDSNQIYRLSRHFTMFTNEYGDPNHTQAKIEQVFIADLEAVGPEDAIIMLNMKDKKKFTGLSTKVLNEAYPGIINE